MFTLYNASNILLKDHKIIIDHADRFEIPIDSDVSYNLNNKSESLRPKDMFKKCHSNKPINIKINKEFKHVCDENCDMRNCSICEDYVKWCEQYFK